jgi:hypothetical protein
MAKSQYWDKPHARIYAEWLLLPAWRELSCYARTLIVELLTSHRPTSPNLIALSDRQIATLLNCARGTASKAIVELEKYGWLEVERVGAMKGVRGKRASCYSLTRFPKVTGDAPTEAYLYWRPQIRSTAQNVTTNGSNQSQQRLKLLPVDENETSEISSLSH